MKTHSILGIEEDYLNSIKSIYTKPTANITVNGEKLHAVFLGPGARQKCLPSLLLFSVVLEDLSLP